MPLTPLNASDPFECPHAMMGLREFIKPSVQYVIEAEHVEPEEDKEGDDPKIKLPRR